jgi:hypothetical protein
MVGSKLTLELVAARIVEGEFFGYPHQKWLNVIFVDPDGIVSSILFKTESMDNFLEVHRQALAATDILLGKAITARMSKRTSRKNGESYFAVEFEMTGPGKYGDAIARFRRETAVEGIYRALSQPDSDADTDADTKAA